MSVESKSEPCQFLDESRLPSQRVAPSQHANSHPALAAQGKESTSNSYIIESNGESSSGICPLSLSAALEVAQDGLSEAMDTDSSEVEDDDPSEDMDISSGSEMLGELPKESLEANLDGSATRPIILNSESDDDEGPLSNPIVGNTVPRSVDSTFGFAVDGSSDTASTTARMSSTPSGLSGSSHTSTGPSNLREPFDPFNKMFEHSNASKHVAPKRATADLLDSIGAKTALSSSSLSSLVSPAKSTSPPKPHEPVQKPQAQRIPTRARRVKFSELQARTSIPADMQPTKLAQQAVNAAYSSRLNPFALHPDEHQLLRNHICHLHVSAYLNIRNRILRLWVKNPLVSVTADEAAGCAYSSRWLGLAEVAYQWLLRKGYINFGCVEPSDTSNVYARRARSKKYRRKTIVVVGAGMSGLGCARQLENLFHHYREKWTSVGEEPPNVILLEGRNRIGGRVYSHPLKDQKTRGIPDEKRSAAELGAHIIVGFDHGNPLNMIVKGQLALKYYALRDTTSLHDVDGHAVNLERDSMVEKLFNDVLDRASVYRHRDIPPRFIEGDKGLIEAGRDPREEGGPPLCAVEDEILDFNASVDQDYTEAVPGGMDKLTGKAHLVIGSRKKVPPALAAEGMGWRLSSNVLSYRDLNLDVIALASENPTLGAAMDEAVKQYQFLLDLTPQDMRMLNWHYANLEYANATNVGNLSLGGWDQDAGNEFEGEHAQVIGGYQQVPRGILYFPSKLDLHTRKIVKHVRYENDGSSAPMRCQVFCEDGESFDADHVVVSTPLGVLKDNAITFDPPLPQRKVEAIQGLGFGTLNKVVLVYNRPFWKVDQDMFGLLRESSPKESLDQEDYSLNRGRFFFFWNCIKTTGRPVLISLMAGDAAYEAEKTDDADLVAEVTQELRKIFGHTNVPEPIETVITRWGQDRFARGSYSHVSADSKRGDYEAMAAQVGTLHFAGEATCATHPATVHGAYISGLRAASEIIEDLLGPIEIPKPLVRWPNQTEADITETPVKEQSQSKNSSSPGSNLPQESEKSRQARLDTVEREICEAIYKQLGQSPSIPVKLGCNSFMLFQTDHLAEVRKACDEARRAATGNPKIKTEKNELKRAIGHVWTESPDEVKRPYIEKAAQNRRIHQEELATYPARAASWNENAKEIRRQYVRNHPDVMSEEEQQKMWKALGTDSNLLNDESQRMAKKMSGYADHSDVDMET